ncbi:hypothetical protein SAMN02745121_00445 [Nannocystis exedens]|uniref:SpoIIAA-like n=1 Tax=Nannocystis exedens TaxID=54 RepID=A0A1I1T2E1_9BACT|nr:hypothetical protein [Nannocystis exedens]PCC66826.1 hypothetical protein NAEX_09422 [Nannocystis exedens]SFD52845.1 hypothetical protein SAMN02745121_00445 [Nannocystis exedens]
MPIAFEELLTPRGRPYVRVAVSGEFGLAEARQFVDSFGKGGPYYMKPSMSVVLRGTEYTSEARKHLQSTGETAPMCTVTSSPLVRAAINLMLRLSGRTGTFRLFGNEPEALAWLDEQISRPPP